MSTSALRHPSDAAVPAPKVVFVVGRYFALGPDKRPDHNGITANIEAAVEWAAKLWHAGFLVFTPHLNTHHFEAKTTIDPNPVENEEYYRAFDRKLLKQAVDAIFAIPNWRESSGGRLEIQLANHLGTPVFEGLGDIKTWRDGSSGYATVSYNAISEAATHFGEGKDLPIAVVDGPYWRSGDDGPNMPAIRGYAAEAESVAIALFNAKFGAFTPQLNVSYERFGVCIPGERYDLLVREMIRRVADCVVLTPGWKQDPSVRERVAYANSLGKPVFPDVEEARAWRDGDSSAAQIVLAR